MHQSPAAPATTLTTQADTPADRRPPHVPASNPEQRWFLGHRPGFRNSSAPAHRRVEIWVTRQANKDYAKCRVDGGAFECGIDLNAAELRELAAALNRAALDLETYTADELVAALESAQVAS